MQLGSECRTLVPNDLYEAVKVGTPIEGGRGQGVQYVLAGHFAEELLPCQPEVLNFLSRGRRPEDAIGAQPAINLRIQGSIVGRVDEKHD